MICNMYKVIFMGNKDNHQRAGYRKTPVRRKIIEALENKCLMSAYDISGHLNNQFDLSTIYRALNILEGAGVVKAEPGRAGRRYCLSGNAHHHITCRECGYYEEYPCRGLYEVPENFVQVEHKLELSGICSNCRSN